MRESEGDPASEGGEGESRAENRGKRKRSSFVVESKLFEVVAEERNGRSHAIISESKGGVVSWVRLGSASVGQLIEGLIQCAKEGKDGRWEKGWNEKGRSYSLVRETNRAGSFIRLGVTDMEKRRFGICIPKGKGEKGGWASMVESLLWVGFRREEEAVAQGVGVSGRSYLEVARGPESRNTSRARIEIKEEEIRNNVSRLKQCLIAKWNPKSTREEELASLGWSAAKAWGLKGKLGLARMGKGCALLEFEMVEEARRVLATGVRAVGGIQLGLEMWSPSFGCCAEEEDRNGAWVRNPGSSYFAVGAVGPEESGGRVRRGEIYVVSLWWEIPPAIWKKQEDGCVVSGQQRGEVREDVDSRAGWRVGEKSGAGTKEQRRSDEVTGEQVGGEGGDVFEKRTFNGWVARQSCGPVGDGSCSSGSGLDIVGRKRNCGLVTQGPIPLKGDAWAADGVGCGPAEGRASKGLELLSHGPAISGGDHMGQRQLKNMGIGSKEDLDLKMEMEFIKCREKETWDKQMPALQCSMAEREIVDEAFRYGSYPKVGEYSSSSSPLFGRTPKREPCDHHGVLRVSRQRDNVVEGSKPGLDSSHVWDTSSRGEKGSDWEESSLAKFSKLLGFSIEGLEREILDFLSKIRKRRERIHSKGLLEKSKFERELKRLECSVKYKGKEKKNSL
ncbi:hypothetical protein CK203_049603 [Vitis vinifera]|uniref:DUF4283 domain-containing protein n=1 Tax=Vitis vinifera TaxID=29760 RepID=A0A438FZ54_VITVI|nr:hypothetical protein CK203_049603 [Vitis vinifera]